MAKNTSIFRSLSLYAIFGITYTSIMGIALITPTLASMAKTLHVSEALAGLVITAFTLPAALFSIFAGVLADLYGRKKVLIPSLIVLAISGAATFFVDDFTTLLMLRVLQGISAAALPILSIVLIGDVFAGRHRTRAIGANASVFSLGTAISPFIGGVLGTVSWNYPYMFFLIALPIALATWLYIEEPALQTRGKMIDYIKEAFVYLRSPRAIGMFAAAFFTVFIIFGAVLAFFGFFLDRNFQASPFINGIFLSGLSLTSALFSPLTARLAARIRKSLVLGTGFLIFAIGLALIPLIDSLWLLAIPIFILGIAQAFNIPALQTLTIELAPLQYRGIMSSFFGIMIGIGQSLGPVAFGLVFAFSGLNAVFYVSALLSLLSAIVGLLIGTNKR